MSNIPTTEGLDVEDFIASVAGVEERTSLENLGGLVEVQIRSGEFGSGDVYLEVADVLTSVVTGRVVLLAGKRVGR